MENGTVTMKELKTTLSASLNMSKGFCCNGILCNGWLQVNDHVLEVRQKADRRIVRIELDKIVEIGKFKIFDEREGYCVPYPNVVLKD